MIWAPIFPTRSEMSCLEHHTLYSIGNIFTEGKLVNNAHFYFIIQLFVFFSNYSFPSHYSSCSPTLTLPLPQNHCSSVSFQKWPSLPRITRSDKVRHKPSYQDRMMPPSRKKRISTAEAGDSFLKGANSIETVSSICC